MVTQRNGQVGNVVLASLAGVLVLAQCGLAAIGYVSWRDARRFEIVTTDDVATLIVLGVSGAVGAVVALLVTIAFARKERGHSLAQLTVVLGCFQVIGVVVALAVVAVTIGAALDASDMLVGFLAVADALLCLYVASVSRRRTRPH
jgi:cellobiose-specific phosphotransferase system component IIC